MATLLIWTTPSRWTGPLKEAGPSSRTVSLIEAAPSRRAALIGREAMGRTVSLIEAAPSRQAVSTGRETPLTASGEDVPADGEETRTRARQQ